MRPADIANASTSRFSRSACIARALSTANSVRSATCSSSCACSRSHARGLSSHITSTAASLPPRINGAQTSDTICILA
jgi:hypothetical protein